jgi:hypothetical protein
VPGDGLAAFGDQLGCGLPTPTAPQISRAGAVEVLYSRGFLGVTFPENEKISQANIASDGPEPGDQFGKALY